MPVTPVHIYTYKGPSEVSFEVPIGGYVHDFSPIANHPKFRRLGGVGQLKPIDMIYLGGGHKRDEHVIGVFGMAQDAILRKNGNKGPQIRMTPYEKYLTLLIALNHDNGHGPYSHVYEIVAEHFGFPDHKAHGIDVIKEMSESIKETGWEQFRKNSVVEDLVEEIQKKGPLYELVTGRLGFDKLDYVTRDSYHCAVGTPPDVRTLVNALDFDYAGNGRKDKKPAFHFSALESLEAFLNAITNNNTKIYIEKRVEVCEGILIRAIADAVDGGFDLMKGYDMTDEQLNYALLGYPKSRELLDVLYRTNFNLNNPFVQAAAIKPEGTEWTEKEDTTQIEEIKDKDIDKIVGSLKLPNLRSLEAEMQKDMKLQQHELFITFSPQIARLNVPANSANIYYVDNGTKKYMSIYDATPGLKENLASRLKRHYGIRMITTEEKLPTVQDFMGGQSFKHLLMQDSNETV